MRNYKCLSENRFEANGFQLTPLRDEDKYAILEIRNEQIYHLRQAELLTIEKQEGYFKNAISELFEQEEPTQILFSVLWNDEFIGYGGLVHINWIDKNAEISFIMKTALETENFENIWINYLKLLEKVAFEKLKFHKIFTYAFDLRPHLYATLEKASFYEETRFKEHCFFEGKYIDVVIHSKINKVC